MRVSQVKQLERELAGRCDDELRAVALRVGVPGI